MNRHIKFEFQLNNPNIVGKLYLGLWCKYYLHVWLNRRPESPVYGRRRVLHLGTIYGFGRLFMVLVADGDSIP